MSIPNGQTQGLVRQKNKAKYRGWLCAYLFIAPLMIGLIVFYIIPFIQSVLYSFTDIDSFNNATFIGMANYQKMFTDPDMWRSLGNTLLWVVITVPIGILLSLIVAALLNTNIKGKSAYRTLYFLPVVTMPAAIAMVWKWIFNGQFGILNQFLALFGIPAHNWITDPKYAFWMVMIVGIWSAMGYNMVILLAGMQGISGSYYEVASIEGANPFQQFFKVTLPLLTPTLFFVLLTSIISGFQVFDIIYMMIGKGSPAYE
ncbi:MAG: sugar ABC transporter permease, partial [Oscillospiraceae bacterium]|nr:sugar ABC transporter permease [Oscillospiraceae bacterium]